MHLTIALRGFYDWIPVPEGVEISEDDQKSGRIKADVAGKWLMRVPCKAETHMDVGIHEATVISQVAMRAKVGRPISRLAFVGEHLRNDVIPQHAHRSHLGQVEVQDDGPNVPAFKAEMDRIGFTSEAQRDEAMADYDEAIDPQALEAIIGAKR